MDFLGLQISRAEIDRWLLAVRDFSLPRLLQSAGQILLAAVLFLMARWILRRVQRHITARTASRIDDHVVETLRRVLSISIVAWAGWRLAHIWELPGMASFAIAVLIVGLSVPLSEFVATMLRVVEEQVVPHTETTLDDTALPLLNKFVRFLIIGGGVVIALSYMGIDIVPFIAGASVAGVAIGFAAKDTLSNLIAGVLLIIDRPFDVGDRIELWQTPSDTATWGDVIEIGLRATKIRNPDNLIFVIPNNQIMQRDIVNYTASGDNIRLRIPIGIAYDADPGAAKEIIRDVALGIAGVMQDPGPKVIIRRFGESSIDLELRVWIAEARQRREISDEITDRVKAEFDRAGVEIPYAKRDLYIRTMPAEAPLGGTAALRSPATQPRGESDE